MTGAVDIIRPAGGAGIACLGFSPFASGTLKGFGDFHIVGWRLRVLGCACHRQNESRWVQLPGKPVIDKAGLVQREDSGRIRYVAVLAFDDRETLRRYSDGCCAALDLYSPGWDR